MGKAAIFDTPESMDKVGRLTIVASDGDMVVDVEGDGWSREQIILAWGYMHSGEDDEAFTYELSEGAMFGGKVVSGDIRRAICRIFTYDSEG